MENDQLVKVTLHGELGEAVGGKEWNLAVSSVGEAMRAIQINSSGRLYPYLFEAVKVEKKYKVLVDGKELDTSDIDVNNPETVHSSELLIERKFKKLDVIPVLEGGLFAPVILGAVLMSAGLLIPNMMLVMIGLALLINGIANLMAEPPDFEEFREFESSQTQASYLFNGPQNSIREGGSVPVGYGRLLVGSQLVGASYEINYQLSEDTTSSTSS